LTFPPYSSPVTRSSSPQDCQSSVKDASWLLNKPNLQQEQEEEAASAWELEREAMRAGKPLHQVCGRRVCKE